MAHGFVRATEDLDLLVQRSRREQWRSLLGKLGFITYREAPAFLQFNPPSNFRLPVDLMFVADEVFERMQAAAKRNQIEGKFFSVVSLLHLIALKCHAISNTKTLRVLKDTDDLIT